jgi:hypothetical protein
VEQPKLNSLKLKLKDRTPGSLKRRWRSRSSNSQTEGEKPKAEEKAKTEKPKPEEKKEDSKPKGE